ncbi:MAG: hypothetical protein HZA92_00460 [Verrucomicrobia bacterium]|nr:hypothetical protein [Verrucomicrobiota bacterium]
MKLGWWLLGFLVLSALGLWLAHERGKAQLNAYKRQLIAKGERLTLAGHVPPPPLAASNGVTQYRKAIERLPNSDDIGGNLHRPLPMVGIASGRAMVSWKQARLPRENDKHFVANLWPNFSAHLADNREKLSELAATLDLPAFNFPFDAVKFLTKSEMEWFMATTKGQDWFVSATLHGLRFDAVDDAWRWWRAGSRLALRSQNPRAVIGLLIHNRLVSRSSTVTWEALQFSGWKDVQLAEIQQLWLEHDALQAVLEGFSMERAYTVESFARFRTNLPALWTSAQVQRGGMAAVMAGPPDAWTTALRDAPLDTLRDTLPLLPWPFWTSYSEEREALQLQSGIVNAWWTAKTVGSLQRGFAEAQALTPLRSTNNFWQLFGEDTFDVWSASRMVVHATIVVQARLTLTAIALHRHRLKHGSFPTGLSALVPAFLPAVPSDFMDGQSLRYRLEADGQFRLWSVGEDFKDDGGDANPVAPRVVDASVNWLKGRDWVWPQPATKAEVAAYHAALAAHRSPAP